MTISYLKNATQPTYLLKMNFSKEITQFAKTKVENTGNNFVQELKLLVPLLDLIALSIFDMGRPAKCLKAID